MNSSRLSLPSLSQSDRPLEKGDTLTLAFVFGLVFGPPHHICASKFCGRPLCMRMFLAWTPAKKPVLARSVDWKEAPYLALEKSGVKYIHRLSI